MDTVALRSAGLSQLQAEAASAKYANGGSGGSGGGGGDTGAAGGDADPEVERRFGLLRAVGEECQTEADLRNLLTKKVSPPNYQ